MKSCIIQYILQHDLLKMFAISLQSSWLILWNGLGLNSFQCHYFRSGWYPHNMTGMQPRATCSATCNLCSASNFNLGVTPPCTVLHDVFASIFLCKRLKWAKISIKCDLTFEDLIWRFTPKCYKTGQYNTNEHEKHRKWPKSVEIAMNWVAKNTRERGTQALLGALMRA